MDVTPALQSLDVVSFDPDTVSPISSEGDIPNDFLPPTYTSTPLSRYIAVHIKYTFIYLAIHPYPLLCHLPSSSRTREHDEGHDANVSIVTDNADTITACVK